MAIASKRENRHRLVKNWSNLCGIFDACQTNINILFPISLLFYQLSFHLTLFWFISPTNHYPVSLTIATMTAMSQ